MESAELQVVSGITHSDAIISNFLFSPRSLEQDSKLLGEILFSPQDSKPRELPRGFVVRFPSHISPATWQQVSSRPRYPPHQ